MDSAAFAINLRALSVTVTLSPRFGHGKDIVWQRNSHVWWIMLITHQMGEVTADIPFAVVNNADAIRHCRFHANTFSHRDLCVLGLEFGDGPTTHAPGCAGPREATPRRFRLGVERAPRELPNRLTDNDDTRATGGGVFVWAPGAKGTLIEQLQLAGRPAVVVAAGIDGCQR